MPTCSPRACVDCLLLVKGWMGHASAETLLPYAHIQPDPLQDLLPLLM